MTRQRGVTLIELVLVMLVLGIIGATAAVFINGPVRAYFDTVRRAQMTDAADSAARRMMRELQGAVPNSVRIAAAGSNVFIEFMPVDASGRYRAATSGGAEVGGTDPLDVTDPADTSFQVLGAPVTVASGAQLVVFNLGAGSFDLYGGANRRSITTAPGSVQALTFAGTGAALNADSPTRRFYLLRTPVTFACQPAADGSGRIERISGYAIAATQPTSLTSGALAAATRNLLIDKVSGCSFEQTAGLANANAVGVTIALTDSGETATLFSQVYLPNTP